MTNTPRSAQITGEECPVILLDAPLRWWLRAARFLGSTTPAPPWSGVSPFGWAPLWLLYPWPACPAAPVLTVILLPPSAATATARTHISSAVSWVRVFVTGQVKLNWNWRLFVLFFSSSLVTARSGCRFPNMPWCHAKALLVRDRFRYHEASGI